MATIAIVSYLGALLLSVFWTFLTIPVILLSILRKGPSRYFHVKERPTAPDCLHDNSLGTHRFAQLKDVKLHYVASGDQGKPLIIFLHGFPEFWFSWRHQIREFNKDYRVVAVDMRGYGESDKPAGVHNYAMEKLAGDIDELIPALGYNSCILACHDWGGFVGWSVTMKYPARVNRLICCNIPHPSAFWEHLGQSKSQMLKSWYIFFFQMPCLPEMNLRSDDLTFYDRLFKSTGTSVVKAGTFSDEELEAVKYNWSKPGAFTGPINYYRAVVRYKTMPVISEEIKDTPVLVLWGTKDTALEREMAELSAKYCNDYTLRFIEGASHWVQQEEPALVNQYMREFLQGKKHE